MKPIKLPHTLGNIPNVAENKIIRYANRAILHATKLLGVATATHLGSFRGRDGGFDDLAARLQESEIKQKAAWEIVELLQARFGKLPERRRPQYNASQRFQILELRKTFGWNLIETARNFLICENTISTWEKSQDPDAKTVGLAHPKTPIRRFDDSVRHLVQRMTRLGFGGNEMIAKHLLAAGWKLCEKTVRNIKRERRVTPNALETPSKAKHIAVNPVKADFVNHVWMMDVTEVKNFFATQKFYLAAVFDAYSRMPLAAMTFDRRPTGKAMAQLLKTAMQNFGQPRHVITDRGGEFISKAFGKAVRRNGATHRYCCVENIYANARLERFWKTLKGVAYFKIVPPLTLQDFETRSAIALHYYIHYRPHTSLGCTPAQAFYGAEPIAAIAPPRGVEGEIANAPPIDIEFLDAKRKELPFLRRKD